MNEKALREDDIQRIKNARAQVSLKMREKQKKTFAFITAHPESIERARVEVQKYRPGLHKEYWSAFLDLDIEEMGFWLTQERFKDCHWQTLVQYSPFTYNPLFRQFGENHEEHS